MSYNTTSEVDYVDALQRELTLNIDAMANQLVDSSEPLIYDVAPDITLEFLDESFDSQPILLELIELQANESIDLKAHFKRRLKERTKQLIKEHFNTWGELPTGYSPDEIAAEAKANAQIDLIEAA